MLYTSARIEAEKSAVQNKEEDNEYKPPTSSLQRTLQDIENSIKSEKRKLSNHESVKNDETTEKLKLNTIKNKPTGTPEYNPTPINVLKKQRVEGKLGRSKYDLALLDGPANDGEYDPASNFSTGSKSSDLAYVPGNSNDLTEDLDSVPDYAKHLHGVKRPAEDDESGEDNGSPLAKIPKFVSVEYTPAVNDSVEYSDEEPLGEKQDWFSDDASEKGSECGEISGSDTTGKGVSSKDKKMTNETQSDESKNLLPIEFTSDGFVKSAYIEKHGEKKDKTKSARKEHDKRKGDSPFKKSSSGQESSKVVCKDNGDKDKKEDLNIFSLFKEEFDNELESCEKSSTQDISGSVHKGKLKSNESKHSSKSSSSKTSSNCIVSNSTEHRHSSKSSDSVHQSSSHSKKERDKKNGIISDKHKHSSKSEDQTASKHKSSSSSSSKQKDSSSRDRHSGSDSHSSSGKHSSSSSSKKSSHDSSKVSNHHSKDHKKSERDSSRSSDRHSHSSSRSKHHSDKSSKSSDSRSKDSRSGKEKLKKKKQIVNLDVDLFGVESDEGLSRHVIDDDMSDLDKYFTDEDPFDECLKIFNEEAANKPSSSTSREGDKKVLNFNILFV